MGSSRLVLISFSFGLATKLSCGLVGTVGESSNTSEASPARNGLTGGIFSAFSSIPFSIFMESNPRREITDSESLSVTFVCPTIFVGRCCLSMSRSSITISNSVIASRAKSTRFLREAAGNADLGCVSNTAKTPIVWPSKVTMGAPA